MLQLKKRTLEEQIEQLENDIAVLDSEYENKTERDENIDKKIADKETQISQKTAELDSLNSQIAEAKNIVMTANIPPRPEVKELPENPTRKERKEHGKQLQAAKEWDDKYKLLQAAQITAKGNAAVEKRLEEMRIAANKKVEEINARDKELHARIAKQNLIVEKEVEQGLVPSNFAELHRQENDRYLQKRRSLFAETLEQQQQQGQTEQQRKQELFEKAKHKTTKKSKGN